ncbi:transketolase family protein [Allofustis seminis]|uniref:transketolase family protein n=1 Tax=Allofustis seminis TaxID=166939 RepID=UPI00036B8C52|nr:transketolase C-terminal domain-containing protein [Allofustis seminis]
MSAEELKKVYTDTVVDLALENDDVFVVESDLSASIGTWSRRDELKEKFVNVGIMEAQGVGVSAGLSTINLYPFYHTFAAFATRRVFDQLMVSLAYSKNYGTILGSDPGICAVTNGGTHMCFEDLALVTAIPNIVVYDVSEPIQMREILKDNYNKKQLSYIRSSRKAFSNKLDDADFNLEQGYSLLKKGNDLTIFVSGILCEDALEAANALDAEGYSVEVIELFRIKPVNEDIIINAAKKGPIVTLDNHNINGGLGSAVANVVSEKYPQIVKKIGVQDKFGQVGTIPYLKEQYGLTAKHIIMRCKELLVD